MIPAMIEAHLREHHQGYEHHQHAVAMRAQDLASAEHVTGHRVAKPVVVKLDGELAIAVVSAAERVRLGVLEETTGATVELVSETELRQRFEPCEPGAEPPLGLFGLQIFVDAALAHEPKLLMAAGTHHDAVVLDTAEWLRCEQVQPVANLGMPVH
jgi:Ala-tRNA(Pro) deacylase